MTDNKKVLNFSFGNKNSMTLVKWHKKKIIQNKTLRFEYS